jgi:hypothetical protein
MNMCVNSESLCSAIGLRLRPFGRGEWREGISDFWRDLCYIDGGQMAPATLPFCVVSIEGGILEQQDLGKDALSNQEERT